jgi:hypothetical protein
MDDVSSLVGTLPAKNAVYGRGISDGVFIRMRHRAADGKWKLTVFHTLITEEAKRFLEELHERVDSEAQERMEPLRQLLSRAPENRRELQVVASLDTDDVPDLTVEDCPDDMVPPEFSFSLEPMGRGAPDSAASPRPGVPPVAPAPEPRHGGEDTQ